MTLSNTSAAQLLVENLSLLQALEIGTGVLDLACGNGRNGRLLLEHRIPVTFADRDARCLSVISRDTMDRDQLVRCWQVDLEDAATQPLAGKQFDAVLVFNYLHRPLFSALKRAVRPGGLIFYETFTVAQRAHGRPRNPDFLLQPGELENEFSDWQVLHSFAGERDDPLRAVASMIARRP